MINQLFDKSGSAGRQPLDRSLRRELESAVVKAREIAEAAALAALTRRGVQGARAADDLAGGHRRHRSR